MNCLWEDFLGQGERKLSYIVLIWGLFFFFLTGENDRGIFLNGRCNSHGSRPAIAIGQERLTSLTFDVTLKNDLRGSVGQEIQSLLEKKEYC